MAITRESHNPDIRIPTKKEADILLWLYENGPERSANIAKCFCVYTTNISSYLIQMYKNTNWINRVAAIGVYSEKQQKYYIYEINNYGIRSLLRFQELEKNKE